MTPRPVDRSAPDSMARVRTHIEESILPPLVALVIAAVVGDVLIIVFGQSPGDVYRQLLEGHANAPRAVGRRAIDRRRRHAAVPCAPVM